MRTGLAGWYDARQRTDQCDATLFPKGFPMTSADDDFFSPQVTDGDDLRHNPSGEPSLRALIEARCSRRTAMAAAAVLSAAAVSKPMFEAKAASTSSDSGPSTLTFQEIEHGYDGTAHVADGYDWKVLLRWGDPVLAGAPAFDPLNQTAAGQERQFGYNNDFIAFLPLPLGSQASDHGLLCVNHEYTIANLMFPKDMPLAERSAIELAAHGHSVVEIRRTGHAWKVVSGSKHARRITALSTKMTIAGPAAGHPRLQTTADPSGRLVIGTLNNCAGGVTPWGTVLIAEENFPFYFAGFSSAQSERVNHRRYGVLPVSQYVWSKFYSRFDLSKEPREPNRFGWMVEFDPYDPKSTPVKRTALGRCRHEGATAVANHDGRVVLYSGDDSPFEYLYRFVSDKPYDAKARENNRDLLDHGVLSVAQFHDDGTLRWSPLVHGSGPLTDAAGFESQADVLIETRRAADLLKATPMDRPEDIEAQARWLARVVSSEIGADLELSDEAVERLKAQPFSAHVLSRVKSSSSFRRAPQATSITRPPSSAGTSCCWQAILATSATQPDTIPAFLKTAGSRAPITAHSTAPGDCGLRPTACLIPRRRPTACTPAKPPARAGPSPGYSSTPRAARKSPAPASLPTAPHCSSRCSIRPMKTNRASPDHRPAGPTSTTPCRRGLRCWSLPSKTAA